MYQDNIVMGVGLLRSHFANMANWVKLVCLVDGILFQTVCSTFTIRYDTVDLRALKSWRDGQLNLAHGPETKNNEKIKIKNRVAQKKRWRQKSVEAVPEEEVKLRRVGFVKEVGFKLGVKERWSYWCTKWWIRRGRSDGRRNRWAGDGGTGARMRFMKRQRELIPETRWSITEGAISYF